MPRQNILPVFMLVLVSASFATGADNARSLDSLHWGQALDSYRAGDFGAAAVHLQKIIQGEPSKYESAGWLLLGKSYLHLGMLQQAEIAARRLIADFPHGRYVPHSHYLLAQIAFQRQEFFDAALQLLNAAQSTGEDDLNLLARNKLDRIFEVYLNEEQRSELLNWVVSAGILAELSAAQQGYKLPIRIGVILPLTGTAGECGQSVLDGIEQACAEANRKLRLDVQIISRDSGGNVIEAIRAAKSLISEEGVTALIGDLDGPCSAGVSAVASEREIPLIIPTAQEVGLTDIGADVYQMLPNYQLEGELVAAYARSLDMKYVAILAPASDQGRQRVKGFQTYFEKRGGEVATVQWYYKETADFRPQLEALSQEAGARLERDFSTQIDTEMKTVASQVPPELIPLPGASPFVSPINYFDAIYLPVQGEEIALLTPQIATLGYSGILLGSSVCLDLVGTEAIRRYVEGMIFPADFPAIEVAEANPDFAKHYSGKTGVQPNHWNVLGWDAFSFLALSLKDSGKLSSQKVLQRLSEIRSYPGARLEMIFTPGSRVNHSLYMLHFQDGRLAQMKSPQELARAMQP